MPATPGGERAGQRGRVRRGIAGRGRFRADTNGDKIRETRCGKHAAASFYLVLDQRDPQLQPPFSTTARPFLSFPALPTSLLYSYLPLALPIFGRFSVFFSILLDGGFFPAWPSLYVSDVREAFCFWIPFSIAPIPSAEEAGMTGFERASK